MAITGVTELDIDGKRGFYESLDEGAVGWRTFLVETNSPSHTEADILAASYGGVTIPDRLAYFPGTIAQCHKREPQRVPRQRMKWHVRCDYKTILSQEEVERGNNPNPLDRRTKVTGKSRTIMVPKRRLLRTPAYQEWSDAGPGSGWTLRESRNSAGDPIDPPIEVAQTEWELHCEKNVSAFPEWFLADSYQNGVNDAPQTITIRGTTVTIPTGCGKLSNLAFSDERRENGVPFITIGWDVTIGVPRPKFGSETDAFGPWDEERLDEGKRTYNTTKGIWNAVRDRTGQALTTDVPFDGAGNPIDVTGASIAETDLWWYAYRPFGPRVDFSIMPWA